MEPPQKRQRRDVEATKFEDLPDEITLKILSHLGIIDLYRCMAVNRKIRAIANDESLWQKLHLSAGFPAEVLKQIIDRGCQYMSLYHCVIKKGDVRFEDNFKLKYLSLQRSFKVPNDNFDILKNLAASCYNLEKFSIYSWNNQSQVFHDMIFKCIIQNSSKLKVLNLDECCLDFPSVRFIFTLCTELVELGIFNVQLSKKSLDFMCENITNRIQKIDLSGNIEFRNEQLDCNV